MIGAVIVPETVKVRVPSLSAAEHTPAPEPPRENAWIVSAPPPIVRVSVSAGAVVILAQASFNPRPAVLVVSVLVGWNGVREPG